MSKAPPIPSEQRAFKGQKPDIEAATAVTTTCSRPIRATPT
jgi:hypothetical protein